MGVEALACGVFPLQTYHSGFKCMVDSYSELFEMDENLKALDKLGLNEDLLGNISVLINTILKCYRRPGSDLRAKVRATARRICTENYSWDSVAMSFLSEAKTEVEDL